MKMLRQNAAKPCNTDREVAVCDSAVNTLPKLFVASMKTLFDILDDRHSGYVKYSDIEKGWQDDGCKGLPRGVLGSLRKVTPLNGLLSFECFCAGLKLCLLRNQTNVIHGDHVREENAFDKARSKSDKKMMRPPSLPLLEIENPVPFTPWNHDKTTTERTQMAGTQRAWSMPQLSPKVDAGLETELQVIAAEINGINSSLPPLKPHRIKYYSQLNEKAIKRIQKLSCTQNQMAFRGCADGGSSSATDTAKACTALIDEQCNAINLKQRESRRHTLQNGIDYNMLRRLKQFEDEREVLLVGLDAVNKAREWYLQQVTNVHEKIKYLDRISTHVEQWSEVQQEQLNCQRTRILQINRSLANLVYTCKHDGFPLNKCDAQLNMRGQKEHEINLKNERITLLEHMSFDGSRHANLTCSIGELSPERSSSSVGLSDADVVY